MQVFHHLTFNETWMCEILVMYGKVDLPKQWWALDMQDPCHLLTSGSPQVEMSLGCARSLSCVEKWIPPSRDETWLCEILYICWQVAFPLPAPPPQVNIGWWMNSPYDDSSSLEWDIIVADDTEHRWMEMSKESKNIFCRKKFLPSWVGVLKIGSPQAVMILGWARSL